MYLFLDAFSPKLYTSVIYLMFVNPSSSNYTQGIQAVGFTNFTSSNLCEKLAYTPYTSVAKKSAARDKSLTGRAGYLAQTFTVSANLNDNNEPGRGCSNACASDTFLTNSQTNQSSKDAREAVTSSLLYSGSECVLSGRNLKNHGNLLDKLKAVHLHVLAMEQWNASRLKLCHRCVFLFLLKLIFTLMSDHLLLQTLQFTVNGLYMLLMELFATIGDGDTYILSICCLLFSNPPKHYSS